MQETISFTPQLAASPIAEVLWLIPVLPVVAAGVAALLKQPMRKLSACLAIGSMSLSLLLSLAALAHVATGWARGQSVREAVNFTWIQVGTTNIDLGWVLDPL
jgi:NADH-quinone oxidoreductase subunit L